MLAIQQQRLGQRDEARVLDQPQPEFVILAARAFAVSSGGGQRAAPQHRRGMDDRRAGAFAEQDRAALSLAKRLGRDHADRSIRPVDQLGGGVHHHRTRIGIERHDLRCKTSGQGNIVGIHPRAIFTACLGQRSIERSNQTATFTAKDPESWVAAGGEQVRGSVSAAIIDHDDLEGRPFLRQNALQSGGEIWLSVSHRQQNRNPGDLCVHRCEPRIRWGRAACQPIAIAIAGAAASSGQSRRNASPERSACGAIEASSSIASGKWKA